MASNKEYLDFILEQLSELSDITYRQMMGEYIVYYRGKIVGGIYDDRFLVKPVKSAISLMPDAAYELPYEGAKQMLVVDNVDSKGFLKKLFEAMYDELPTPKNAQMTPKYTPPHPKNHATKSTRRRDFSNRIRLFFCIFLIKVYLYDNIFTII